VYRDIIFQITRKERCSVLVQASSTDSLYAGYADKKVWYISWTAAPCCVYPSSNCSFCTLRCAAQEHGLESAMDRAAALRPGGVQEQGGSDTAQQGDAGSVPLLLLLMMMMMMMVLMMTWRCMAQMGDVTWCLM